MVEYTPTVEEQAAINELAEKREAMIAEVARKAYAAGYHDGYNGLDFDIYPEER